MIGLGLGLALLAACSNVQAGVVRIWINRTLTPIEVQEAFVPACSIIRLTAADLAAAEDQRSRGVFPKSPPGTVDLTTKAYQPEETTPLPLIIVELADGREDYLFGTFEE